MVICLERGADLHMAQLLPLQLTVSCFSKIQIGFTFLVSARPASPGKRAVKRVCVCACVCVFRSLLGPPEFGFFADDDRCAGGLCAVRCGAGGRDGARATLAVRAAGALVAQLDVTYEADVTGDVAQIYVRQLDAACSALLGRHASRGSVVTAAQLDTLLTGAVFDDVASSTPPQHSLPPRAFELLFDSAKYAASGNVLLSFATIHCVQIETYIFFF